MNSDYDNAKGNERRSVVVGATSGASKWLSVCNECGRKQKDGGAEDGGMMKRCSRRWILVVHSWCRCVFVVGPIRGMAEEEK